MTRSKTKRTKRDSLSSQQKTGWVFVLIFVISVVLTVFVLFMQREWKHSGQRTILVVHDAVDEVRKPLTLVISRFENQNLEIIRLPEEQAVNVVNNEVSYSSDALVGHTQLETYRWSYLEYLVGLEYGVIIDGIMWTDISPEEVSLASMQGLARQAAFRQANSNMSYWDRWQWWQGILKIPGYEVDEIYALNGYLNENQEFNDVQYQKDFFSVVQDPVIRNGGWSIAILNGSGIQGYASRVAAALELMGYEVRSVDTIETVESSSLVFAPPREDAFIEEDWAEQRLRDFFSGFPTEQDEDITRRRRSDAVIILGTDQDTLWLEE